ncbi:hypothetical protein Pfo_008110 [Paulownia fortunei]|nr:hypothetical protein Pfo_008110 [Paulownia fortunei]
MDENQQVLPLAFAIVDEETTMMDLTQAYGPRDPSLLSMQSQHRSEIVMTRTIDEILHGRRADGPFWQLFDQVHPHARVLTILHHMGFYGVYRCGRFIADFHLITALVERWRRETHTFHFRVGEATITLQDVAVIWGLPIDGRPVTGVDHEMSIPQWVQYCEVTLGFHPAPEHFRGARLYTTALAQHMRQHPVTDDSDEEHVHQYARACAFMLFGGVMCPDSSGNSIPLLYLPKFENVDEVSGYSWGSAVLAFLYRELCTACSKIKCNIGGALQLLQFIWQPYDMTSQYITELPPYCSPQLWTSTCPLIFYARVEMHHPERVLRQFGMIQNIPPFPQDRDTDLHRFDRRGYIDLTGKLITYSTLVHGLEDLRLLCDTH